MIVINSFDTEEWPSKADQPSLKKGHPKFYPLSSSIPLIIMIGDYRVYGDDGFASRDIGNWLDVFSHQTATVIN
jgi:hypothetical protein